MTDSDSMTIPLHISKSGFSKSVVHVIKYANFQFLGYIHSDGVI